LGEKGIYSIQQVGSGVWIPCLRYWRNLSGANVLFLFGFFISSFPYSVFFIVIFRYICFWEHGYLTLIKNETNKNGWPALHGTYCKFDLDSEKAF
jgi:hypothetical protein